MRVDIKKKKLYKKIKGANDAVFRVDGKEQSRTGPRGSKPVLGSGFKDRSFRLRTPELVVFQAKGAGGLVRSGSSDLSTEARKRSVDPSGPFSSWRT